MQMNYIKQQSPTKDGKLLAIGHSMGGILLYAMVSKCGMYNWKSSFDLSQIARKQHINLTMLIFHIF